MWPWSTIRELREQVRHLAEMKSVLEMRIDVLKGRISDFEKDARTGSAVTKANQQRISDLEDQNASLLKKFKSTIRQKIGWRAVAMYLDGDLETNSSKYRSVFDTAVKESIEKINERSCDD